MERTSIKGEIMLVKGAWTALTVEWPEVEDAHITLAHVPHMDSELIPEMLRFTDSLKSALNKRFEVETGLRGEFSGEDGRTTHVITVRLPGRAVDIVHLYREGLTARGVKHDQPWYPFIPHVIVGSSPKGEPFSYPEIPDVLMVTGLTFNWGDLNSFNGRGEFSLRS